MTKLRRKIENAIAQFLGLLQDLISCTDVMEGFESIFLYPPKALDQFSYIHHFLLSIVSLYFKVTVRGLR